MQDKGLESCDLAGEAFKRFVNLDKDFYGVRKNALGSVL